MPRPDGMLQCTYCGGRTVITAQNGVIIKNGRRTKGTVIVKDVCADCWKQGRVIAMKPDPDPPKIVK